MESLLSFESDSSGTRQGSYIHLEALLGLDQAHPINSPLHITETNSRESQAWKPAWDSAYHRKESNRMRYLPHIHKTCSRERETEGLRVQGQLGIHSEILSQKEDKKRR